jgi:hypothetical protein
MIASRSFRYDGKRLSKGSEFDVISRHVRLLSALGHAKVKVGKVAIEPAVNPSPRQKIEKVEPEPEKITSDPAEESKDPSKEPDEFGTSTIKKPKRRYKRRDMEAE